MAETPTYCPLCGTKEPHECESKPAPKSKPLEPTPMGMPERKGPGKYTFPLDDK